MSGPAVWLLGLLGSGAAKAWVLIVVCACRALSQTVLEALYQQTKEIAQGLEEEGLFPGIDDMEGRSLQTAS